MINGRCYIKEGVPEINRPVTLLTDYVVKMFKKCFSKYLEVVISINCVNPVAVKKSYISVFSAHYFYREVLDSKNIKISLVILKNTFFNCFFQHIFVFLLKISFFKSSLIKLFFRLPVSINDNKYIRNIN